MNLLRHFFLAIMISFPLTAFSDQLPANYELMSHDTFQQVVVGHSIVGVSRQSHSLYMLYFLADGSCEMWKDDETYTGSWWTDKDELGRDFIRAFWPQYTSSQANSLFSPENPSYGTATAVRYYFDAEHGAIMIASKTYQAPALLVPGRSF